jgi:methylated-DNA-[protein]-cysteine S-methyltransferase
LEQQVAQTEVRFATVSTAIGALAVAWTEHGIVGSWMHAGTVERAREQLLRTYASATETAPPESIATVIEAARRLLSGEPCDLQAANLDLRGIPDFDRRVYEVVRMILPGHTMTYGQVATALGEEPMKARDVGIAMARNRFAPFVPCHRVVAANGKLGGYSAPGGTDTKRRLLEIEGVQLVAEGPLQIALFDAV